MRLLFVSSAEHFGGTERWASMAIAELERRGHQIWMACPDKPHAENFTLPERLWHEGPKSMWDRAGMDRMAGFCRDQQIDCIIPLSQKMYFTCGRLARQLGIALVLRLGIVRLPWRPVVDWYGYGIYPDAIIVNTQRIKQVLSRAPFVKRDRIHVIYNGIVERPAGGVANQPEKFTITSVGTLSWRKGMEHLIKAVALLPDGLRKKVHIKLIGEGPARGKLTSLAQRLDLAAQVEFTGHVENPTAHIAASDLFVLLSAQEGISNALLEAMNCAVPAYTTLVGGHGEFVEHGRNAYAARSRRPSQVAADLAGIMSDHNIGAVGAAGRDTVRDRFSMTAMGDRLEEVLKLAAKGPTGKPAGPDR
ncbi:glycosyltransferase [Anderseniella sp. Alg231-50]|uniref:glycosyltransferase n=1 Tax=Anderseniella sp. Alg231-50 TaxID=1922226 RepID=UPI000D554E98